MSIDGNTTTVATDAGLIKADASEIKANMQNAPNDDHCNLVHSNPIAHWALYIVVVIRKKHAGNPINFPFIQ